MTNVILAYDKRNLGIVVMITIVMTRWWLQRFISWTGITLSLLPQRQLHLYHSLQLHSTTKACLRIRLCRRSRTCVTQGQPCLRDLHMVVEFWQAPASSWRAFCCKNRKDLQTLQVWNIPARLGDTKGPHGGCWRDMTNIYLAYTRHMLGICLAYTYYISFLSKKRFLLDYALSPAWVVNGIHHFWNLIAVISFFCSF